MTQMQSSLFALNMLAHYENMPMQYTEIFKVVKNLKKSV